MKQNDIKNIAAIAVGAALGTSLRYYLNVYTLTTGYPVGTLIENLSGSLLLGFFTGWFVYTFSKEWLKVGLTTGLCGGFTTMSTFAADSMEFLLHDAWWVLMIYLMLSILGGLACASIGYMIGQKIGSKKSIRRESSE